MSKFIGKYYLPHIIFFNFLNSYKYYILISTLLKNLFLLNIKYYYLLKKNIYFKYYKKINNFYIATDYFVMNIFMK